MAQNYWLVVLLSFSSSLSMLLSTSTRYTLRTKRKMCTASPKHKLS